MEENKFEVKELNDFVKDKIAFLIEKEAILIKAISNVKNSLESIVAQKMKIEKEVTLKVNIILKIVKRITGNK